jgi:Zn-finger nucleic acid-binding protein
MARCDESTREVRLNCPVCDKPMVVFEIDEVEVDHCVGCGGTWLDAGELELLLDGAANRDDLLASMGRTVANDEVPRRCPICDKKMQKVQSGCGDNEPVTVDKCKRNHGLWFDRGELTAVMNMGEFPCDHKIYELLGNVFSDRK